MLWGDFRHFFASVQISSLGEDWGEVAALMGHANSAFTYRQYGHYVRNVEKQKQVTSATAAAMGI
jgi:integrase